MRPPCRTITTLSNHGHRYQPFTVSFVLNIVRHTRTSSSPTSFIVRPPTGSNRLQTQHFHTTPHDFAPSQPPSVHPVVRTATGTASATIIIKAVAVISSCYCGAISFALRPIRSGSSAMGHRTVTWVLTDLTPRHDFVITSVALPVAVVFVGLRPVVRPVRHHVRLQFELHQSSVAALIAVSAGTISGIVVGSVQLSVVHV